MSVISISAVGGGTNFGLPYLPPSIGGQAIAGQTSGALPDTSTFYVTA